MSNHYDPSYPDGGTADFGAGVDGEEDDQGTTGGGTIGGSTWASGVPWDQGTVGDNTVGDGDTVGFMTVGGTDYDLVVDGPPPSSSSGGGGRSSSDLEAVPPRPGEAHLHAAHGSGRTGMLSGETARARGDGGGGGGGNGGYREGGGGGDAYYAHHTRDTIGGRGGRGGGYGYEYADSRDVVHDVVDAGRRTTQQQHHHDVFQARKERQSSRRHAAARESRGQAGPAAALSRAVAPPLSAGRGVGVDDRRSRFARKQFSTSSRSMSSVEEPVLVTEHDGTPLATVTVGYHGGAIGGANKAALTLTEHHRSKLHHRTRGVGTPWEHDGGFGLSGGGGGGGGGGVPDPLLGRGASGRISMLSSQTGGDFSTAHTQGTTVSTDRKVSKMISAHFDDTRLDMPLATVTTMEHTPTPAPTTSYDDDAEFDPHEVGDGGGPTARRKHGTRSPEFKGSTKGGSPDTGDAFVGGIPPRLRGGDGRGDDAVGGKILGIEIGPAAAGHHAAKDELPGRGVTGRRRSKDKHVVEGAMQMQTDAERTESDAQRVFTKGEQSRDRGNTKSREPLQGAASKTPGSPPRDQSREKDGQEAAVEPPHRQQLQHGSRRRRRPRSFDLSTAVSSSAAGTNDAHFASRSRSADLSEVDASTPSTGPSSGTTAGPSGGTGRTDAAHYRSDDDDDRLIGVIALHDTIEGAVMARKNGRHGDGDGDGGGGRHHDHHPERAPPDGGLRRGTTGDTDAAVAATVWDAEVPLKWGYGSKDDDGGDGDGEDDTEGRAHAARTAPPPPRRRRSRDKGSATTDAQAAAAASSSRRAPPGGVGSNAIMVQSRTGRDGRPQRQRSSGAGTGAGKSTAAGQKKMDFAARAVIATAASLANANGGVTSADRGTSDANANADGVAQRAGAAVRSSRRRRSSITSEDAADAVQAATEKGSPSSKHPPQQQQKGGRRRSSDKREHAARAAAAITAAAGKGKAMGKGPPPPPLLPPSSSARQGQGQHQQQQLARGGNNRRPRPSPPSKGAQRRGEGAPPPPVPRRSRSADALTKIDVAVKANEGGAQTGGGEASKGGGQQRRRGRAPPQRTQSADAVSKMGRAFEASAAEDKAANNNDSRPDLPKKRSSACVGEIMRSSLRAADELELEASGSGSLSDSEVDGRNKKRRDRTPGDAVAAETAPSSSAKERARVTSDLFRSARAGNRASSRVAGGNTTVPSALVSSVGGGVIRGPGGGSIIRTGGVPFAAAPGGGKGRTHGGLASVASAAGALSAPAPDGTLNRAWRSRSRSPATAAIVRSSVALGAAGRGASGRSLSPRAGGRRGGGDKNKNNSRSLQPVMGAPSAAVIRAASTIGAAGFGDEAAVDADAARAIVMSVTAGKQLPQLEGPHQEQGGADGAALVPVAPAQAAPLSSSQPVWQRRRQNSSSQQRQEENTALATSAPPRSRSHPGPAAGANGKSQPPPVGQGGRRRPRPPAQQQSSKARQGGQSPQRPQRPRQQHQRPRQHPPIPGGQRQHRAPSSAPPSASGLSAEDRRLMNEKMGDTMAPLPVHRRESSKSRLSTEDERLMQEKMGNVMAPPSREQVATTKASSRTTPRRAARQLRAPSAPSSSSLSVDDQLLMNENLGDAMAPEPGAPAAAAAGRWSKGNGKGRQSRLSKDDEWIMREKIGAAAAGGSSYCDFHDNDIDEAESASVRTGHASVATGYASAGAASTRSMGTEARADMEAGGSDWKAAYNAGRRLPNQVADSAAPAAAAARGGGVVAAAARSLGGRSSSLLRMAETARARRRGRYQRSSAPGAMQMHARAQGQLPQWTLAQRAASNANGQIGEGLLESSAQPSGRRQRASDESTQSTTGHGGGGRDHEVVAVAVEAHDEDAEAEAVVFAKAESMPSTAKLLLQDRNVRICICVSLAIVCAISIAVGITVGGAGANNNSGQVNDKDDNEMYVVDKLPTAAPSPAPTISKAPTVDLTPLKDTFEKLGSARYDLDDPDSPQHRAMIWMSFADGAKMAQEHPMYYQRYAAVVLYYSLEGPAWIQSDDWLNPQEHECLWGRSITCRTYTGRQYLSVLDLSGYDAAGTLPPEIGMLVRLEGLYLNRNSISGTIPDATCDLSSLSVLEIGENALSGTVPDCFRKLTSVTALDLSANSLQGPMVDGMFDMINLRILDLSYNQLTGSISNKLQQLQSLTVANIRDNQLTGPIPVSFGDLSDLAFMYLDNNMISGAIPFFSAYFGRREEITLSNNMLTGMLPQGLPTQEDAVGGQLETERFRLQKIDFSRNGLSGPLPALVGFVPSLRYVDISSNKLTGSIPLTYGKNGLLNDIEHIAFANNKLVGTIPDMGNIGNTKHIDLKGNNLVGGLPDFLWKFSQLEYLNLDENPLGGQLPDKIGSSPMSQSLFHLHMRGCQLEGEIPTSIGRLAALDHLDLGDNNLGGSVPPEMGSLDQLTELVLGRNNLVGTIPADLGQLQKVTILDLSKNNLVGSVPEKFGELRLLEDLYLEENQLAGSMPRGVCNLSEKNVFRVDCNEVKCDCCEVCR